MIECIENCLCIPADQVIIGVVDTVSREIEIGLSLKKPVGDGGHVGYPDAIFFKGFKRLAKLIEMLLIPTQWIVSHRTDEYYCAQGVGGTRSSDNGSDVLLKLVGGVAPPIIHSKASDQKIGRAGPEEERGIGAAPSRVHAAKTVIL